jgi:FkbM family methyltransferase
VTSNTAIDRIIADAARRESSHVFDAIAGEHAGLVVAGASGLIAEHTLKGLRQLGIRPVALVDNDPARWGERDGMPVMSPDDALRRHPDAAYVASIFTHTPLRRQLAALGARRVVSYAALFHKHAEVFLPYFAVDDPRAIVDEAEAVRRAADVWADDESRDLYTAIVEWFARLNSDAVPPPLPASATYFPDVLELRPDEVFVDCGAYDGDTVLSYLDACGGRYERIFALEPDPATFRRLTSRMAHVERAVPMNRAVGARPGRLRFVASGGLSSHAASAGANGLEAGGEMLEVDVAVLDELTPRPTYVKMDIEGFERDALEGARNLLEAGDTAFAVTLYHRMRDLWQLPVFIRACAPRLRLFLRHYAEDWAETICYAVPAGRVRVRGDRTSQGA